MCCSVLGLVLCSVWCVAPLLVALRARSGCYLRHYVADVLVLNVDSFEQIIALSRDEARTDVQANCRAALRTEPKMQRRAKQTASKH